jgi:hypothetical protein
MPGRPRRHARDHHSLCIGTLGDLVRTFLFELHDRIIESSYYGRVVAGRVATDLSRA